MHSFCLPPLLLYLLFYYLAFLKAYLQKFKSILYVVFVEMTRELAIL